MNACYVFFDEDYAHELWQMPKDEIYPIGDKAYAYFRENKILGDAFHPLANPSPSYRRKMMDEILQSEHDPELLKSYDLIHTHNMWFRGYDKRLRYMESRGFKFNQIPDELCDRFKEEWFNTDCNDFPDWRNKKHLQKEAEAHAYFAKKAEREAEEKALMRQFMEAAENQ